MRYLFSKLFNNLKDNNKQKVLIGRWSRDYDTYTLERKVYLANMDHCGCCENIKNKDKIQLKIDNNDEHLIPYLL
jgi:hypothetical protein